MMFTVLMTWILYVFMHQYVNLVIKTTIYVFLLYLWILLSINDYLLFMFCT